MRRAAGAGTPPSTRMLAAKGMAPLAPADTAIALYQISQAATDEELELRDAALETARQLPDRVLAAALAADLDGRVLHFFAHLVLDRPLLVQAILYNRATPDETFAHLAGVCDDAELEAIARNEQRLLRHPAIIAALYGNRRTRMSTAQRAVELAIRNGLTVDIPAFEEIKAALEEEGAREPSPLDDAAFEIATHVGEDVKPEEPPSEVAALDGEDAPAAENEPDEDEKATPIKELPMSAKVRLATVGNAFQRSILIRDKSRVVAMAVIRAPSVTDTEAARYASNREVHEDIIRFIANKREWMRLYSVKLALCNNPKTPLSAAIRFLAHLTPKDLRTVSRSKSVPAQLAKSAQALLAQRQK